ncbi:MAG: MFS transporter [Chloroflexi bacterium]|nr:MFS transporter [Chloroflexota bacterium]
MSRNRIVVVTFGILMGLFLASIEGTVVGTAMPTIISQLQGIEVYAWVFSMYMLTSTSTMPIFGKLSDIYGRRPIYMVAVAIFLIGSILCGTAQTMTQLIIFRALQGIGAGGLLPLAFTIIGDIFTMEQRAKMQGLFSGVWGVSSLLGPLVGGFLVDNVSWRAVFYVNLPFGLITAAIIWFGLRESHMHSTQRRSIDYIGTVLLVGGIVAFLLALLEGPSAGWTSPFVLGLLVASIAMLAAFVWNESHVDEPIISPTLFHQRLFGIASLHGFLTGMAMFGSISFIPLFAQGVLGLDATSAGAMLIPTNLGWVTSSTLGGRLLLKFGHRRIVITCMIVMTIGTFLMSRISGSTMQWQLWLFGMLMGFGMGGGVTAFLISVQSAVTRRQLGAATSTLQFMRNVGGTVGVSIFGTVMTTKLIEGLARQGNNLKINPQLLLDRANPVPPEVLAAVRGVLAEAIGAVFALAFIAVAIALVIVLFTPRPATRDSTVPSEVRPEVSAEIGTD